MDRRVRISSIFVPEHLPSENKGEMAILFGIRELFGTEPNVTCTVMDRHCRRPCRKRGITIFPHHWLYPRWRQQVAVFGLSPRKVYSLFCAYLRHWMHVFCPRWVLWKPLTIRVAQSLGNGNRLLRRLFPERLRMIEALKKADIVAVGHDGVFSDVSCHVIDFIKALGHPVGVLGCGLRTDVKPRQIAQLYARTLPRCDFIFMREVRAFEWIARLAPPGVRVRLAPDPAFALPPARREDVGRIVRAEGLEELFSGAVVLMTVVENAIITRWGFPSERTVSGKCRAHYELIASLVQHIVDEWGASVVFLPHSIGPTAELDDRRVAREAVRRVRRPRGKVRIIENEYGPSELKGLIANCEMVIGERIHSIIGAISTATPFICLGSRSDPRTIDIIGDMCHGSDKTYFLEEADADLLRSFADKIWENRAATREELKVISGELRAQLRDVSEAIKLAVAKTARGAGGERRARREECRERR
jgi:polysaccharide pyruvyl transferase WcaK-like protein